MTKEDFRFRYNLPPDLKLKWTKDRIMQFYHHFAGSVFLSFSGGKDSQVLAEIIRSMGKPYSDIELVFFDTHNEDKSVYEVVDRYGATVVPSPYTPKEVVEKVGYPLFNKELAHVIDAIQRGLPYIEKTKNENNRKLIEEATGRLGIFTRSPLRISDKCCTISKKNPSKEFTKKTGKEPIVATLAVESYLRMQQYLKRGCNAFEGKIQSTPIAFWKKDEILQYVADNDIKLADCYGAKITNYPLLGHKKCTLCGKQQTGCLYCGFGKGVEYAKKILKAKCPEYVKEHQEEFDNCH